MFHPLNPDTLTGEASKAVDFLVKYYENVGKYPVRSQVRPGYLRDILPKSPPEAPEPLENILEDIEESIVPGLTHWQSPNFYAYFSASASNAGLIGEILCSGLNVIGFNWISSPAATELETVVIDWMGRMLNLPQEFLFSGGGGGVMHGSTCEAVVCTLAAARDRALRAVGEEKINKLVVYASDQTHCTFQKGAKLVGIPPRNFRALPTSSATDFALCPKALRAAMEEDIAKGLVPLYVCATIGATSCGAIVPIHGLGLVAQQFGAWLHVDAAYAGSACICPEYQHHLHGAELADSISMNPYKWLLTNVDCTCLWIKNPKTLVDSLSTDPEYLKNEATEAGGPTIIDYKDWQISLSRRFRALKLWLVIRRYGLSNLMAHIRSDIDLAKYLESLVLKDARFELVVPRKFSLVCFRLMPNLGAKGRDNLINQKLLETINSSGKAFLTHSMIDGTFFIRCAIGVTLTEKCHIEGLWRTIQDFASEIVEKNGFKNAA